MQKAIGMAVLLLAVACASADDQGRAALVGTWVGTSPSQPGEVIFIPAGDGTFTWSVFDIEGTWEGDATSLRLNFGEDSPFCSGGYIDWAYEVEGSTLTADVVGGDCGDEPVDLGDPSPDWVFQRQN